MDAVKFLEEAGRMCRSVDKCSYCALGKDTGDTIECLINLMHILSSQEAEDCVKIVEEWAKNNPKKTRAEELKRLFPNSSVGNLCIKFFDTSIKKCEGNCLECIEKFWNEEVEGEGEKAKTI